MTTGDHEPQPEQPSETSAAPPPSATGQQPGGLGPRFAARLIDGLIVVIVTYVAYLVALLMDATTPTYVVGVVFGLLWFIYHLACETALGWTPGKKLLGLTVQGPAGAPKPTAQQAAIRNVWTLFSIIPIVGGLLTVIAAIVIAVTINSSPTKQGKHDDFAGGTQVVKG
jgi:uncharacterized RDD family membrane protein YckC